MSEDNKTFCGKTKEQMKSVLYFMCDIEDEIEMDGDEEEMFDVAIQCVTAIINRMDDAHNDLFD